MIDRDNCEVCHGARGGVPGNENRVNGVVMCDYCHSDYLDDQMGKESVVADHFSAKDEARLHGARGNLAEAVSIVEDALRHGDCPLSKTLADEARKLASSTAVLLGRLGAK